MFRPALQLARVPVSRGALTQRTTLRLASTVSRRQSGGLRSFLLRWGLAGAIVYYYNTSSVFADEAAYAVHAPPETETETESYPTIEAAVEQRRAQARAQQRQSTSAPSLQPTSNTAESVSTAGSAGPLEEEASEQGAFNEETGEINWDCPCLGGMAHGPCGEQFRAAFSCFVYSKEEPKGVDCIEHFKTMQNCFRDHPDVYGAELEDDEVPPPGGDERPDGIASPVFSESPPEPSSSTAQNHGEKVAEHINTAPDPEHVVAGKRERAIAATQQVKEQYRPVSETDDAVPKAWHDTRAEPSS